MVTLALLSDIHGNLPALEAVAADIDAHAPDATFVLGDMIHGCPWSAAVLDLIQARGWPMLLGNHDDAVLQLDTPRMEPRYGDRSRFGGLWWTRSHLAARRLSLLDSLPRERVLHLSEAPSIRLIHGIPGNFYIGIRPNAPEEWVASQLAPVEEDWVAAAHTHVPLVRRFGRWLLVNSGSVGAPYDEDTRAAYLLLTGCAAGWRAEVRRIEYDLTAVDVGFSTSGLLEEAGVAAEMFRRSVLSGQPWVADFFWWIRDQPAEVAADMPAALRLYDLHHGPGRWAFPYA